MKILNPASVCGLSAAAFLLVPSFSAKATPYASGLTNNAGTISFRLNEDADKVVVRFNGGATSLDLGNQTNRGVHSFNLGTNSSYEIVVTKASGAGYPQAVTNQISFDTNNFVKFANGRGIAINTNVASPYFGRVYVTCGSPGTANGRSTGDGVYILNADQTDAVGQGDAARSGGVNFNGTSQTEGPFRITVGTDDLVYITDNSDSFGTLWITDPDVTSLTNVFATTGGPFPVTSARNHGSILAVHPEGKLADGNLALYVMDEDLQTDPDNAAKTEVNSIWIHQVNGGPFPLSIMPTKFCTPLINTAAQYADTRRGPDGKWYSSQRRAAPATTSGVLVRSADGTANVWTSLQASRDALGNPSANDLFVETRDVAISADGKYLATINNTNGVFILPVTDGIPDMTNRALMVTQPTTTLGRAVAFDIAGNLYTLSSGQGVLRVYSRGGFTIASTRSDGTFEIFSPTDTVSVTASDNFASEFGDTAEVVFTRTGNTNAALTVGYSLSGTAANGADYSLPGTITFAPGEVSTNLTITAIDDNVVELTEALTVGVTSTTNYTVGGSGAATISIADNETPELSLGVTQPAMYERTVNDYITFQITRKGDTNVSLTANVSFSGTATNGVNYSAPPTVDIQPGVVNQTFQVTTIDDNVLQSTNLTVIASVVSGTGYNVGTPTSATGTIIDDELPAETVLFADSLNDDTSTNWTVLFGSNNGIDDYNVNFAYDVVNNDGLPAAPNGSSTALKLAVNKNDATAAGAAGLNLYPIGKSFSGDYALRFDMYLQQNSGAATSEFATFGVNHSGTKTNWNRQSVAGAQNPDALPKDGDGLWFSVVSDASAVAPGDYCLFTGTNAASAPSVLASAAATSFVNVFKKPPFSPGSGSGSPGNVFGSTDKIWVNVEVKKIGSVVTLSINKTPIITYTNTTPYTSGDIMLGYMDPYDSIGGTGGSVYYSNVRVVNLTTAPPTTPSITGISVNGNQVQINFTGAASDAATAFALEGKATVDGTFANETGASIVSTGTPGSFRATVTASGATRFYRIRR